MVSVDGVEYTRKEILEKLLDAAIGNTAVSDESLNSKLSKHITEEAYPWAYPHINPEKGYPQPLSINKWMQPIKVSFGMPYNFRPFVSPIIDGKPATEYETWPWLGKKWIGPKRFYFSQRNKKMRAYETYKIAENETKSVVEQLSLILPVPINYLAMEEETPENYGNLRINLFNLDDLKEATALSSKEFDVIDIYKKKIKITNRRVSFPALYPVTEIVPSRFEKNLKAMHFFTRDKERQVYGYFLSKPANEIDFAVCHIWEGHEPKIIKGLVRECIIRSLGFMDPINLKRVLKTVPENHRSLLFLWGRKDGHDYLDSYSEYFESDFYLTDMDRILIKTLYRPELKAGTSYLALRQLFKKND